MRPRAPQDSVVVPEAGTLGPPGRGVGRPPSAAKEERSASALVVAGAAAEADLAPVRVCGRRRPGQSLLAHTQFVERGAVLVQFGVQRVPGVAGLLVELVAACLAVHVTQPLAQRGDAVLACGDGPLVCHWCSLGSCQ